jgi:hypothetical protein
MVDLSLVVTVIVIVVVAAGGIKISIGNINIGNRIKEKDDNK